jgi:hypothetical protein
MGKKAFALYTSDGCEQLECPSALFEGWCHWTNRTERGNASFALEKSSFHPTAAV